MRPGYKELKQEETPAARRHSAAGLQRAGLCVSSSPLQAELDAARAE
eukprot:COSAG01_NODE_38060_length_494_cov_21.367089_1_plen_46_part_10